jgi:hypothetical protein
MFASLYSLKMFIAIANMGNSMTLKELADKFESLYEDVFASLPELEYTHDDQPVRANPMGIVRQRKLRFCGGAIRPQAVPSVCLVRGRQCQ